MHYFKQLLPMLCASSFLYSCAKSDTNRCATVLTTAPSTEVSALQAEMNQYGHSAVGDNRGFFYVISRLGDTAVRPSVCSSVKVSYTLRLLNNTQLEAGNNAQLNLSNVIPGWQEGVPLIGEGGFITLYIPPSLAYGASGSGKVPPNTNLMFQIELVDVL